MALGFAYVKYVEENMGASMSFFLVSTPTAPNHKIIFQILTTARLLNPIIYEREFYGRTKYLSGVSLCVTIAHRVVATTALQSLGV